MYELFSNLIINQIKEHINSYSIDSEGEKWLIDYYGNSSLNEIFEKMMNLCEDTIDMNINGHSYTFKVWNYNKKIIIPCRVKNPEGEIFSSLSPNYCSREFNGKLRDFFYLNNGVPVEDRILLTLDNEPMETQKASRILTAPRQPLHFNQLVKGLDGNVFKELSGLNLKAIKSVIKVWKEEIDLLGEDQFEEILEVINKTISSTTEAKLTVLGNEITKLNIFLPLLGDDENSFNENNLRKNIQQKKEIDKLFSPEIIVEKELEEKFESGFAQKLIKAYLNNETSLYEFNYEDFAKHKLIETSSEDILNLVSLEIINAVIVKEQNETKGTNYIIKAGLNRKDILVNIEFNRALTKESIHTFTGTSGITMNSIVTNSNIDEDSEKYRVQFLINIDSIKDGHFAFCSIDVKSGKRSNSRSLNELKFAIVKADEKQPVFYEQSIKFDIQFQAFTVSGLDDVICLLEKEERHNEEILIISDISEDICFEGTRKIRFKEVVHEEGTYVTLRPSWDDQEFFLPLWLEPEEKVEFIQEENSIFEMLLKDRINNLQNGSKNWIRPDIRVDQDTILFRDQKHSLGSKFYTYLSMEKEMLENSSVLIWQGKKNVDSQAIIVTEHPLINDLPNWDSKQFQHFLHCRKRFFVRLREKGISSLLLTFLTIDEEINSLAKEYVNSYINLCEEISTYNEEVKEEYLYVIYTDLIELNNTDGTEEILLSPTHPLHVAYLMELSSKVDQWLEEKDDNFVFGERDFQRLSTSDYIPLIQFKQKWYKVIESDYIAWNKYQIAGKNSEERQVETYVSKVFSDKIMQFIDYHPIIFLPKINNTTLFINVFNPGDGKFVLDALREFFSLPHNREDRPKLHVNLIGTGKIGTLLDLAFSIEGVPEGYPIREKENEIFQIIRDRVSYTKQTHDESLPYAHLTFVIKEFQSDVRGESLLNSFSSSVYGEGLIPKVSRKLKSIEREDTTKTYVSALWVNEDVEKESYGCMAYISRVLQEQFTSLEGILKPFEARMQRVDVKPSKLKEETYKKSRWVIHLDREIGLEVFKSESIIGEDSPIILDFSNQYNPQKSGYDVITTTLQVKPYISRVKRILNLSTDEQANKAVSILNNLSGRWALNLVRTNDTNVAERIGNVVTFQYLKLIEKVFENDQTNFSIIVSLEEFLRVNRNIGLPTGKGWINELGSSGQYSDDLLLLTIYSPKNNRDLDINLRVIEVKFGSSSVKKGKDQVLKTHNLLATRFGKTGLTDQIFRAMDFANLVLDGIDRAVMYGLLEKDKLSAIKFDEEIFPRLISNRFKLFTDGTFKGERFKGDVINISREGHSYQVSFMDDVRVITIPNKYFIPLLEENGDLLTELTSEYTTKVKEHSIFGFEPDLTLPFEIAELEAENLQKISNSEESSSQLNNNSTKDESYSINSEIALHIGKQVGTDEIIYWDHRRNIQNPLANHNIIITGDPGKGKTQTIKGLMHELRSNHIPILVFDFKDDYINTELLEEEKIGLFDIMLDGLPFNPLIPSIDPDEGTFIAIHHIVQIEGIIKRIYDLGIQQSTQLRTAIIEAFKRRGINPNLPTDLQAVMVFPSFTDVQNILLEEEKKNEKLLGRLDLLFQLNLFRDKSIISFEQLMDNSYILRLSRLPMKEIKSAVAEMIILAIHNFLVSREQPRKLTRAVVLDEAHRVSQSEPLLELMREGRAFGIGMIIATQFPSDIPQDIYGCTETKLFLGNDFFSHAESAARQIEGGVSKMEISSLADEIRNMKQFRAVLRNSQYSKVFLDILPYYKR
jgi:hypothetical protein